MDDVAEARKPTRKAHNRKLNEKRVIQLAEQGFSTYEIARTQGVNHSSVHRFLESYQIEKKQTEAYKVDRANLLSYTGSKFHSLVTRIADELQRDADNGVLAALGPEAKGKLARDLSVVQGVVFDKERLERGESTSNVSLVAKIMAPALSAAFAGPQAVDNPQGSTPSLGVSLSAEQGQSVSAEKSRMDEAGVRGEAPS